MALTLSLARTFCVTIAAVLLCLCGAQGVNAQDDVEVRSDSPAPITTTLDTVDPDDVETAFRRMRRNESIQFDLRTDTPTPPPPPPAWLVAIGAAIATVIGWLGHVLVPLFYILVGALGMLLIYAVANAVYEASRVWGRDTDNAESEAVAEYRPTAAQARVLLEDADALAQTGQFAEAVHLLLYRSIQDIERTAPGAVRLSLTAREIGASPLLAPKTRTLFGGLARIVERSHFGSSPVSADDYARARQTYVDFAGFTEMRQAA